MAQTLIEWEAVVVYDGPMPSVMGVHKVNFLDSRIRYFELEKNHNDYGHTPRAYGSKRINPKTEGVVFTGSDCYYAPNFLEIMTPAFLSKKTIGVYCNFTTNYNDYTFPVDSQLKHGHIDCGNVIVRAEIAKEIGWKNRRMAADWDYIEEIINKYGKDGFVKIKVGNKSPFLFVHN
jgi:hypothetical protein